MGNQRTPRISAGVRSQTSKDVLLFFLSSPGTLGRYSSILLLPAESGKKNRPYLLLMFPSCHPAGKTLPSLHKFSKTLFLVALIKCLCWLCFSSGRCPWEMEMQGSAGLVLRKQLQIYCSGGGMNLKRGANCGHGLTGCHCLRGKGGAVPAETEH